MIRTWSLDDARQSLVLASRDARLPEIVYWGAPLPPVAGLPIASVAPGICADGPADELTEEMKALYAKAFAR